MMQRRITRRAMLVLGVFAASVGLGIGVGPAFGQSEEAKSTPDKDPDTKPAIVAPEPEKAALDRAANAEEALAEAPSAERAKPGRRLPVSRSIAQDAARKGGLQRGAALQPNPEARFACAETTATAEPTWRSPTKTVDFTFEIRNEGTEVLQIRAKGG